VSVLFVLFIALFQMFTVTLVITYICKSQFMFTIGLVRFLLGSSYTSIQK